MFRKTLKDALELLQFKVRVAENGLIARTIFDLNSNAFDLILSDVKMPELDGIKLLQHVRKANKDVKFIMMTGFTEVIEAKQAHDLGVNEFLTKPFRAQGLRDVIRECFAPKIQAEDAHEIFEPQKYCRIPVEEFISSTKLQTDIYVRLGANKYIKIAHAGDVVPMERLQTYMDKKIDAFFVLPEDMRKIVGFTLAVSKIANSTAKVPFEKRVKLFNQTATLLAQNCHLAGVDREMVHVVTETIDSTLKLVSEDDGLFTLLSVLNSDTPTLYGHSVAVSAYSCMIGKKLGMGSLTAQFRLSLAGMLHDIGKRELPVNVLSKTRIEMNAKELEIFESHPQRGKEILARMPGVPEDIVLMVSHHHETLVGTGYPYGVSGNRIHPLGKILCVAEVFCSSVQQLGSKTAEDITAVIQRIWNVQERELDAASIRALASLFNYELKAPKPR